MNRDRQKTERAILDAVGTLVARRGMGGVGINAVAREAQCDKVLIYRYFGDLSRPAGAMVAGRLLAHAGGSRRLLRGGAGRHGNAGTRPAGCSWVTFASCAAVRSRRTSCGRSCWERNSLTDELAEFREKSGIATVGALGLDPSTQEGRDAIALGAVLHAGLTYLVLRAKTADVYLGVDLTSDEGWGMIEAGSGQGRSYTVWGRARRGGR